MELLRGISRMAALTAILLVLAGCAGSPGDLQRTDAVSGDATASADAAQAAEDSDCPVSAPIQVQPPELVHESSPLPRGEYYVSADKKIWAVAGLWRQGGQKVPWVKPLGSQLVVQGRRLDGDSAPLWASLPAGFTNDFQPSRLLFPSSGCWEIETRADASVMRIVVKVAPQPEPKEAPSCARASDVLRINRPIIHGRVESILVDASGRWAWQTVRVVRDLLYPFALHTVRAGQTVVVLQDVEREPFLAVNKDYLLVLDGSPWRIVCPLRTVARIDSAQMPVTIEPVLPGMPLWIGGTLPEVESQVREAVKK